MNDVSKPSGSKGRKWAVGILLALVTLTFAMSGILKVMRLPMVVQAFVHMGIPQGAILPLGIVELSCLILYLIPRTAVLGTFLLTGYLGGAVLANIINRSDFIHAFVVGFVVWAGTYLRVTEIQRVLPLRRSA
jgi:hypothetical protein